MNTVKKRGVGEVATHSNAHTLSLASQDAAMELADPKFEKSVEAKKTSTSGTSKVKVEQRRIIPFADFRTEASREVVVAGSTLNHALSSPESPGPDTTGPESTETNHWFQRLSAEASPAIASARRLTQLPNRWLSDSQLPNTAQGSLESIILAALFLPVLLLSGGSFRLETLVPMFLLVGLTIGCMILAGVYRKDIASQIGSLFKRTVAGFLMSMMIFLLLTPFLPAVFGELRFVALYFFFAFIVIGTLRPVICGTDVADAGNRRGVRA